MVKGRPPSSGRIEVIGTRSPDGASGPGGAGVRGRSSVFLPVCELMPISAGARAMWDDRDAPSAKGHVMNRSSRPATAPSPEVSGAAPAMASGRTPGPAACPWPILAMADECARLAARGATAGRRIAAGGLAAGPHGIRARVPRGASAGRSAGMPGPLPTGLPHGPGLPRGAGPSA